MIEKNQLFLSESELTILWLKDAFHGHSSGTGAVLGNEIKEKIQKYSRLKVCSHR